MPDGAFACITHLRAGSFRVTVGDVVAQGTVLAECGNSGNSTEPHVHLQVMDAADPTRARGLPLAFRDYREWDARDGAPVAHSVGIPRERAIVEAL